MKKKLKIVGKFGIDLIKFTNVGDICYAVHSYVYAALLQCAALAVLFTRAPYATARVSGVRCARCAPFAACAWQQSPRALSCYCAPPIKERAFPASIGSRISTFIVRTLPVFVSASPLPLVCGASSPLSLCTRLCSASAFVSASPLLCVVSAFCFASVLLCPRLCVRLVCASPLPFARRLSLQHKYSYKIVKNYEKLL